MSEKIVIPIQCDFGLLDQRHNNFHRSIFEENRNFILSELRMLPSIRELVEALHPEEVYKLVLPEGRVLQKGKDGLYRGVFYHKDGGGIESHGRFKRVGKNVRDTAKAIGTQFILLVIAVQLDQIERSLKGLEEQLHHDRIAEIEAGVRQFEQSLHVRNRLARDGIIVNAIQNLNTGIQKSIRELKWRIEKLPNPKNKIWDNWLGSKSSKARREIRLVLESFHASTKGVATLTECYAALREPQAGAVGLRLVLEDLENCDIVRAAQSARLVEYKGGVLPEAPLLEYLSRRKRMKDALDRLIAYDKVEDLALEVEFKPYEMAYNGGM